MLTYMFTYMFVCAVTQKYLHANPAIDEEAVGEFACGSQICFTLVST